MPHTDSTAMHIIGFMSFRPLAVVLGSLLHDQHSDGQRSVLNGRNTHVIQAILIDTGLVRLEPKEKNENVGRQFCI